ncbi:MAG: hypothetical protein A2W75_02735 [Nitrospinae bacterium RIFCSPLOWO2_12_39_15]|nr:MAG: hypothetical protein A2W75_02735 [Nitrospinae bacterium RIFCSPLOWO2_12_39_15]
MKQAIIVDLDGTLANCDHRRHFVEQKPKDWNKFYAGIEKDTVNKWCKTLLQKFHDTFIIIVSGRPDNYRDITLNWLEAQSIFYDKIFMRKSGDYRTDYIVKKELYEEHIKGEYEVIIVIDDRKQVVNMWRKEGLVCLQCAEGEY